MAATGGEPSRWEHSVLRLWFCHRKMAMNTRILTFLRGVTVELVIDFRRDEYGMGAAGYHALEQFNDIIIHR